MHLLISHSSIVTVVFNQLTMNCNVYMVIQSTVTASARLESEVGTMVPWTWTSAALLFMGLAMSPHSRQPCACDSAVKTCDHEKM